MIAPPSAKKLLADRVCACDDDILLYFKNVNATISSVEAGKAWTDDEYKRSAGEVEMITQTTSQIHEFDPFDR